MPTTSTSCGVDSDAETVSIDTASSSPTQPDVLNEFLLRMTRAVLQHPEVDTLYVDDGNSGQNKRRIYKMLHELFTQWQTRQKRVKAIQLNTQALQLVVELCACEILTAVYMASGTQGLARASSANEFIARAPLLAMDTVRSRLTRQGKFVLAPVLAQVLGLSRRLDEALALHTPLGAINAVHLAALAASLSPGKTLADVARAVAQACLVDWPRRMSNGPIRDEAVVWTAVHLLSAVWMEWALLDTTHDTAWGRLSRHVSNLAPPTPDGAMNDTHLTAVFASLARAMDEEPLLRLTLSRGPDAVMSCDLPAPRAPSISVHDAERSEPVASHTDRVLEPTEAHARSSSEDGTQDDEAGEQGVDLRFWRDLAS